MYYSGIIFWQTWWSNVYAPFNFAEHIHNISHPRFFTKVFYYENVPIIFPVFESGITALLKIFSNKTDLSERFYGQILQIATEQDIDMPDINIKLASDF